jgi:RNA polymerase sigma factor (sigma-70 family)
LYGGQAGIIPGQPAKSDGLCGKKELPAAVDHRGAAAPNICLPQASDRTESDVPSPAPGKSPMDVDLRACTRGDKRAWDAFVTRWSGVIYAAVRHVLHRNDAMDGSTYGSKGSVEVDDATQEVFVRLVKDDFRLLKSFDPGRATLSTWLTIVARSVAIDCTRRKRLNTSSLELHDISAAHRSPNDADAIDRSGGIDAGSLPMHLLTERQRSVLRMLFDEGLTVAQAARRMGVDDQTIRSTKHKALTRLRQHFGVDTRA